MTDKNTYRVLLDEAEKLLTHATDTAVEDRIALREAVCAFLIAERANGSSVETVLESVEAILMRAELRVGKLNGHSELARRLVEWCIQSIDAGTDLNGDGSA